MYKLQIAVVLLAIILRPSYAQTRDELAKDPVLFITGAAKNLGWAEPTEPTKLVGPIYYVGTKGLASYLITTTDGHILMYTGMPGSGPMIEASIRKLGFKPEDIKYILTGHAHIDHVGGHAYMKKVSQGKVVMMAHERELIESGGKTDFHYGKVPEFWFDPVKVDLIMRDGDSIKLGSSALRALHTPGHTRGSTTWTMTVSEGDQSYVVVFPDGTSINPGYRVGKNPSYPGIADDFNATLETLGNLKPDMWFAPHPEAFKFEDKHQRAITEGVQAWVDPEGYRALVARQRRSLNSALGK